MCIPIPLDIASPSILSGPDLTFGGCNSCWAIQTFRQPPSIYSFEIRICETCITRSNFKIARLDLCFQPCFQVLTLRVTHVVHHSTHTFFLHLKVCRPLCSTSCIPHLCLPYTARGKKLFIIKFLVKLATHASDRFSNVVTRFIFRRTVG